MANSNPENQISSERRAQMPSRGRNKRTLILESIREAALLGMDSSASNEETEKALFKHMAKIAINPADEREQNQSSTCLTLLLKKGWPDIKPQSEPVEFELTAQDPSGQASQILQAIANGIIPIDQGASMITAMASVMKIREIDELEQRIKALETMNAGKEA